MKRAPVWMIAAVLLAVAGSPVQAQPAAVPSLTLAGLPQGGRLLAARGRETREPHAQDRDGHDARAERHRLHPVGRRSEAALPGGAQPDPPYLLY